MKILEIDIQGIRGIPSLKHDLKEKNFAVCGPNGSGKSGLVDAIDFLLTGEVKRLTGQGTGSITLKDHGPHITKQGSECFVSALVKIDENATPIKISRKMSSPQILDVEPQYREVLNKYITIAKRGHHVLTRRDLLRFITAEDSTRASDIQALLNLGDIEGTRKIFAGAAKDIAAKAKDRQGQLEKQKSTINALTGQNVFSEDAVLKKANEKRGILKLPPATTLSKTDILADVLIPKESKISISWKSLSEPIEKVKESMYSQTTLQENAEKFLKEVKNISENQSLLKVYSQMRLVELGLDLAEDDTCPLCDETWNLEELKKHLNEKLDNGKQLKVQLQELSLLSGALKPDLLNAKERIDFVYKYLVSADLTDLASRFQSWSNNLKALLTRIEKPLEGSDSDNLSSKTISSLTAPTDWENLLEDCLNNVKEAYPEVSDEKTAMEYLTNLAVAVEVLRNAEVSLAKAEKASQVAEKINASFAKARDELLNKLYDDVSVRFAELYGLINEEDESAFKAALKPDGAGVSIRVAFYDYGMHPPNALHSEGHQDSMGLCLYLALMEKLTEGAIGIVVLDDVVMSIDSEHRRKICELLKKHFSNRQLIITTHDKVWANQLKSVGIIGPQNLLLFSGWDVLAGPQIEFSDQVWQQIEKDLNNDQIPVAAAKLRRLGEQFLATACEELFAPVSCRQDGKWEFGELLFSASSRFKDLLKTGREAALSWDKSETETRLETLDKKRAEAMKFFMDEQGVINQSVHYNSWYQLTKRDFKPVVEALKAVTQVFNCENCNSLFTVLRDGKKDKTVSCSCGDSGWNLNKKSKVTA